MQNLEKYTFPTKNGRLLSTEPFPNGNMLRSTAELLILVPEIPEGRAYMAGIEDCRVTEERNHQLVYSRYPDRAENTSIDDLLIAGSVDTTSAQEVLASARSNLGFYSVDGKRIFPQFIFRFQGMWQHLRMVAEEKVGLVGQAIWALSLYLAAKKPITNQDNWVLSHLMVLTYNQSRFKSKLCDLAIRYWQSKKTKTTSQIMSEYIGDPAHPLVEAWKKYN
jgi:hypothetical protein